MVHFWKQELKKKPKTPEYLFMYRLQNITMSLKNKCSLFLSCMLLTNFGNIADSIYLSCIILSYRQHCVG